MKWYWKLLKIIMDGAQKNKPIREKLKVEDQWLENFYKETNALKYFRAIWKEMRAWEISCWRERERKRDIWDVLTHHKQKLEDWPCDRDRFRCTVKVRRPVG